MIEAAKQRPQVSDAVYVLAFFDPTICSLDNEFGHSTSMNRHAAYTLLTAELNGYRQLGYAELADLVGDETSIMRRGSDGRDYSIILEVRYCDAYHGDIIVTGSAAPADWGSPYGRLDESIIVAKPRADR